MIVKMRKMDLLLYHREQENFLEKLRGLGVVHITSEQPVDSAAAQELSGKVQLAQRVAAALKKVQAEKNIAASSVEIEDVGALLARYDDCETERERINQEFATLKKDNNTLAPWGDFNPQSVKRLAEVGVDIKFYVTPAKKFDSLDKSKVNTHTINVKDGLVYFVSIFRGEAPGIAGAEEVRLPDISLKDLNAKVVALEERRAEVNSDIATMAGHITSVEKYRNELLNSLQFEQACMSMKSEAGGKLLKLTGWVPKQNEGDVAAFLQDYPAYVAFADPAPGDSVPVKLKNGGLSSPFESILKLYSLPGYGEIDFAPFVAPFFAIFFGLCLGDAGYGLLLMIASLVMMFKVGPKMKPFATLGILFGFTTTLCGVFMNGFFGMPIFGGETLVYIDGVAAQGAVEGTALFAAGVSKYAPLAAVEVGNSTVFPTMGLALVAAFVQLFCGIFLNVYMKIRDRGIAAGIQPFSYIVIAVGGVILGAHTNFMNLGIGDFAVGKFHVGNLLLMVPQDVAKWMAIGGIVALLMFDSLDKKFYMRPLGGLWTMYNFVTGFLSNVLSYLRLFALGLAGGLLGAAVNEIAFMFVKNAETGEVNYASIGMVLTVLLLIGGHALNMALAALGAFVHPLRLTFVEFYGQAGFEGGGKPFVPFQKIEN